jgi:uncharacterized DUF497 family protein
LYEFRWNQWNVDHLAEHGISPEEAEWVVRYARPPYPEFRGEGKWLVRGQTAAGRFLQVIYIVDPEETLYVIHSRPLTDREKWQCRRRIR